MTKVMKTIIPLLIILSACVPTETPTPDSPLPTSPIATPTEMPTKTWTETATISAPTQTDVPKTSTSTPVFTASASPTARTTLGTTDTPQPTATVDVSECTLTIPASQRTVENVSGEHMCFELRETGVRFVNVSDSIADFTGVTITETGSSVTLGDGLTVINYTVDAQTNLIGIQVRSAKNFSILDCDIRDAYIGVHFNVTHKLKEVGPDESLGILRVEGCTFANMKHESVYLGYHTYEEGVHPVTEMTIVRNNDSMESGWDALQVSGSEETRIDYNRINGHGMNPQNGEPDGQTKGIVCARHPGDGVCRAIDNYIDATVGGGHGIKCKARTRCEFERNAVLNSGLNAFQIEGTATLTGNEARGFAGVCVGGGGSWTLKDNICQE
jgi:hypothetical protein